MCPVPSQPGVGHCKLSRCVSLGKNLLERVGEQGLGDSLAVRGLCGGLCMLNQSNKKQSQCNET